MEEKLNFNNVNRKYYKNTSNKSYRKKSPYKGLNCKRNAFCAKKNKDVHQF